MLAGLVPEGFRRFQKVVPWGGLFRLDGFGCIHRNLFLCLATPCENLVRGGDTDRDATSGESMLKNSNGRVLWIVLAVGLATPVSAQMSGQGPGLGMHHGADGRGHDERTMPGLRGLDATPEESAELAVMFRNFHKIERSVTNLPNGIRTVTFSSDQAVMNILVSHVAGMIARVKEGRDPKIMIQSPTLDIFFARGDEIETEIDITDEGIVVVQTAKAPELVEALHVHAAEVSDMADRGMAAVHDLMMRRAGN